MSMINEVKTDRAIPDDRVSPFLSNPHDWAAPAAIAGGGAARGFIRCDITAEIPSDQVFSPNDLWLPRFPDASMVKAAAALIPCDGGRDVFRAGTGRAHYLHVSPGSLRISNHELFSATHDVVGYRPESGYQVVGYEVEPDGENLLREVYETPAEALERVRAENREADLRRSKTHGIKTQISEWSSKSRANMVKTLSTLDYAPMVGQNEYPAMITLTWPGDWERLAPSGEVAKAKLKAWKARFEYDWARKLVGIWKLEFQGRGAPHFHILMTTPSGLSPQGETFKVWLSRTWAEIVGAAGEEFKKHLAAGTSVDRAEGLRAQDPKRAAIYFLKHAAPGGAASKEYQHRVPELWKEEGKKVGRFWGYWGLKPAVESVPVSDRVAVEATRILRKIARAQHRTRQVMRPRRKVNKKTGELVSAGYRRQTIRAEICQGGRGGFLCLNDAPAVASQIARALRIHLNLDHVPANRERNTT